MASDLTRGAVSGKETKLYYNSGTDASPTWVEIKRARNVQVNDGPSLNAVEFHGANNSSNIPGYAAFSGSFEYVKKRGADSVYDAIETARRNGDIIQLQHLNDDVATVGAKGWKAPCVIGEKSETSNGNDPVVATFPFGLADAYDELDDEVGVEEVEITV